MANEKEIKLAKKVYKTICSMLDDKGIGYTKHEDGLAISCTVHGNDIPMDIIIFVHPERHLVRMLSPMPFEIPQDKRTDMAFAVNMANYGIVDGSFDYSTKDGDLRFRMTASYREKIPGKDLFEYMFMVSAYTTDHYNDRFMRLAEGRITLEQFAADEE